MFMGKVRQSMILKVFLIFSKSQPCDSYICQLDMCGPYKRLAENVGYNQWGKGGDNLDMGVNPLYQT